MARSSALTASADTCPLCQAVHGRTDPLWSCPQHEHKLGNPRDDGDWLAYRCPVRTCKYERSAPRPPRNPAKGDAMTAVATRPSVAVDTMWARSKHISGILPPHVEVKSFIGTAMAALYADAKLMAAAEKNPESLVGALMECASLGHRPGTEEYYLTPRGGKILGIEGYRGIVERMYRSGAVAAVIVREVCAKDEFRFTEGQDEVPLHKIAGQPGGGTTGAAFFGEGGHADRGEMVGVYAYAKLTTGGVSRVVLLSKADVLAARDAGDNDDARYSPWHRLDGGKDHPEFTGRSMWWKTAVKRLEPWVPTSAEYRNAEARAAAQAGHAAGNGQQSFPAASRKPDPAAQQAIQGQIDMEWERLGIVDGEERAVLAAKLTGSQPGDVLAEPDLMKVLTKLEGCDDTAELHALPEMSS